MHLSLITAKFLDCTEILKKIDSSIRNLRNMNYKELVELKVQENLIEIIQPIIDYLEGKLSDYTLFNEMIIVKTIELKHERDWTNHKKSINRLFEKIKGSLEKLDEEDFEILEEIADAIDSECARLYRRLI